MIDVLRTKALSKYFHRSGQFYYILADLRGVCSYINPLFLRQHNLTEVEIVGLPFHSLLAEGEISRYYATLQQCVDDPGTPCTVDIHHRQPDGSWQLIRWEFQALSNDMNTADVIQGIGIAVKTSLLPLSGNGNGIPERFMAYELSAEGLWRLDFDIPPAADWPAMRIIEHCRKHGYIGECNDNMAKMYGLEKAEELIGMKLDNLMNLRDSRQVHYFEKFIQNGYRISGAETHEYDVNGNGQYFLNNMTGIVEDGLLKRIWGTQQNVTEKKKTEEQLMRSELFYRNLIGGSLYGILLTDSDGLITFASPSVEKILGYHQSELVRTSAFSYVHPDDCKPAFTAFETEVNMEPVVKQFIDIRLRSKDGKWIPCSVRGHNMLYNPFVGRVVIYFHDDTHRKMTELALRESESRYRLQATQLDTVSDVITTTDLKLNITSWNRVAEELSGIPAVEAIGHHYRDVLTLDYSPYSREEVADAVFNGGKWQGEISFINRKGEKKYLLHTISIFPDAEGQPAGLLGVGKDITERKKAEAMLQESESFYRNLIANSLDGILLANREGKMTYCSASLHNLSGYDAGALAGKSVFEFVHPDDVPVAMEAFDQALKQSVVDYVSIRLKHSSGAWIWSMVRAHNLLDHEGFNAIVIYFTNDTRRKHAEDKLRESEELFRHLITNLKTGVIMQDIKSRALICNDAAYELLDLNNDQLSLKVPFPPTWNVIHENGSDFPVPEHPYFIAIQTKKIVRDVVMGVYRPSRNDRVWLMVTAEPILDDNNEIVHVVIALTDISEQKKLAHELIGQEIQKQKLLTQATIDAQEKERREIGKELHDNISQHLTTTRLYLEVAQEKAMNDVVKEMIFHAHRELSDIINEIRKLSQSLVPPTLGDIGLVESVQDICDSLKRTHTFTIEFNHRYFSEKTMADNMKLMLFRIIQEQINNIIRHAGANAVNINLGLRQGTIELVISDNGKGFDRASIGKKGLGLSNIINRAGLFNGKVDINSAPGRGCTIRVVVPAKQA
jgi:PAS domain S-box-containing protein